MVETHQWSWSWIRWLLVAKMKWWSWSNLTIWQLLNDDITSWSRSRWLQVSHSNVLSVRNSFDWLLANDLWVGVLIESVLIQWDLWSELMWLTVARVVIVRVRVSDRVARRRRARVILRRAAIWSGSARSQSQDLIDFRCHCFMRLYIYNVLTFGKNL